MLRSTSVTTQGSAQIAFADCTGGQRSWCAYSEAGSGGMDECGVTEVVLDKKSKLKKSPEGLLEGVSNAEGLLNVSDVCITSAVVEPTGILVKVLKPKVAQVVPAIPFVFSICMKSSFVSFLKLELDDGAK